ncbi:hypothetical protein BREU_2172 [Bifidobacterium reuteri DSM 23975]|uniref:Uncharacterized protein n=1 Tax=Bifidobacterium reuteri DSM 23975 TaxID=1437610 RepID=A0A087CF56_9BIFI|nr:hypothetical protein BREU_2172 [Bifidobacterium reuteri DSM 23975]
MSHLRSSCQNSARENHTKRLRPSVACFQIALPSTSSASAQVANDMSQDPQVSIHRDVIDVAYITRLLDPPSGRGFADAEGVSYCLMRVSIPVPCGDVDARRALEIE